MSSPVFQRYTGLPSVGDGEVEEILTAKACFVMMNGSNGFSFTAPLSLLSRLSAPVDALVHSAVEGAHACVNLEVSDKDTFYRFFQFVYMGSYDELTSPENAHLADDTKNGLPVLAKISAERSDVVETRPVLFGASSTSAVPGTSAQSPFGGTPSGGALFGCSTQSVPSGDASFGFGGSTRPVFGGGGLFGRPQTGFKLPYSIVSCRDALRKVTPPLIPTRGECEELSHNNVDYRLSFKSHAISAFLRSHDPMYSWQTAAGNERDSFGNVFVGHAKVWKFAEKYAIAALMDFSTSELIRELACWMIKDSAFVTDFGQLVRHSYHDCSAGGIAQFAACIFEDAKDLDSWQELLKEVPAFHSDLGHALAEVYSTWQPIIFRE
ncbi:hypothetical protein ISF_09571 [Cordyceps fumosorosea ARSEF 2679]|uniref:BTB domain-containing protein n=1 Tax=Cordyceps fumosorosea (strain ARSEF 2679) TaxID=1081104 RepID=A0A167G1N5_CORFA|nr:hypothetical protein ISF_09571 [Cordyceps fumosorosea ARSEF 2679]OAA46037.1 hypothetical protein ISF_09571 [Cordyceps fumosorosea ARSEF 2679]